MGGLGLGLGLSRPLTAGGVGGGFVDIVNNGVLAPFVTFTRNSAATRINAAGQVELVAANVPRIDYDPATGELRGLLIEEQRTNLLLNSASLSTQSVTVAAVTHTLSFTGTGTVTLSGASTAGPLVGTGATSRVTLTFTPTAGLLTLTVSGSVTLAQLEAGNYATSYIPTAGTAVTRAAESATASPSSVGFVHGPGTMLCEFAFAGAGSDVSQNLRVAMAVDDGSPADRLYIYNISGSVGSLCQRNSVTQAAPVIAGTIPAGQMVKAAFAFAENDFIAARDGMLSTPDTSGALPDAPLTVVTVGGANGANKLNGWVRNARYYPRRLSNAQLQALTA